VYDPLIEFIKNSAKDTDIFCFQELFFGDKPGNDVGASRVNLAQELAKALPDFIMYPRLAPKGSYFMKQLSVSPIGQAIFIRKNISIVEEGGFFTYPADSPIAPVLNHSGNFQYLKVRVNNGEFLIGNLHGLWQASGKRDTPERLEQSGILQEFYNSQSGKKIICGDFNLRPETKSISILEESFKNLIKTYNIKSTRSHFYKDADKYSDYISDYAFVSRDVDVKDFRVLNNIVSDHLAIELEFN